jgi:hypothetical protein
MKIGWLRPRWLAKKLKPVDAWHKKAGSKLSDISLWLNPGQKMPELLLLVSQRVLWRPLSYPPFLPISALEEVLCQLIPLLHQWHPLPFLHGSIPDINSQAEHFLPYLLIQTPVPIYRQMQALEGREHPAWTACITLFSLPQSDRVLIPTSSG